MGLTAPFFSMIRLRGADLRGAIPPRQARKISYRRSPRGSRYRATRPVHS